MIRLVIIGVCGVIIASTGVFGTLYDPGHPWMDRKRKIGVSILLCAGIVELAAIMIGQV